MNYKEKLKICSELSMKKIINQIEIEKLKIIALKEKQQHDCNKITYDYDLGVEKDENN